MQLDHINILVEDWDKTVRFYQETLGLLDGNQVPHGQKNYLYTADKTQALIHLTSLHAKELTNANLNKPHKVQATPGSQNQNTGAIDHIAFRITPSEFELLRQKLEHLGIAYRISEEQPQQLWFFDPNVVKLEITNTG